VVTSTNFNGKLLTGDRNRLWSELASYGSSSGRICISLADAIREYEMQLNSYTLIKQTIAAPGEVVENEIATDVEEILTCVKGQYTALEEVSTLLQKYLVFTQNCSKILKS
jgi:hypothetical protein